MVKNIYYLLFSIFLLSCAENRKGTITNFVKKDSVIPKDTFQKTDSMPTKTPVTPDTILQVSPNIKSEMPVVIPDGTAK